MAKTSTAAPHRVTLPYPHCSLTAVQRKHVSASLIGCKCFVDLHRAPCTVHRAHIPHMHRITFRQ
eukprot:2233986-Rhodomonas_salina.1